MTSSKSSTFQLPIFGGLLYAFENEFSLPEWKTGFRKLSFKLPALSFVRKTNTGISLKPVEILKTFSVLAIILMVAYVQFNVPGVLILPVFCFALIMVLGKIKNELTAHQHGIIIQNESLEEKNASLEALIVLSEQQQEKLKRTILLKERLISIISHDVRVPLNAFKFLIECYENGFINEATALAGIIDTKKDLVKTDNMIVDLVNFARTGKSVKDESILSFQQCHEVMESVLSIYTLCAKNKNLDIVPIIDMPENKSLAMARRDVEVVMRNLLSNAIKYSNTGGKIIVSLKVDGNNTAATLSVQDFGKGMNEQMLKKLCKNKVISSMGTQDEIGLGIGLNIIYDVINDYNLTYDVKSKVDCGTEFSVQLPISC